VPDFFSGTEAQADELASARTNSSPPHPAPDARPAVADALANDQRRTSNDIKSVETEIKYEGYLQQQQRAIERLKKAEQRNIPEWFDYRSVSGLSREMQEKLIKIRPRTLGHASRIPGVTPAAVSLVNVYIEIQAKRREQAATHVLGLASRNAIPREDIRQLAAVQSRKSV